MQFADSESSGQGMVCLTSSWCQLHCKERKPSVMGIAVRFVTFFSAFPPTWDIVCLQLQFAIQFYIRGSIVYQALQNRSNVCLRCTLPTKKLPGIQEYYSCARRNLMRWTAWSLRSSISLHTQQRLPDETNLHALVLQSHYYTAVGCKDYPQLLSWLILMILTIIQQAD
jgi:hypothetical protein